MARLPLRIPEGKREKPFASNASADASHRLNSLWRDICYALRKLKRSPGFAAIVILTLALAIGVNLAVFQLLYSVMFATLPVPHPNELVALRAVKSPFDGQWFLSYPAYQRLRQATAASAPLIARSGFGEGVLQMQGEAPEQARFQMVSDNFFSVLGVSPFAGRLFLASDARPGQSEWPVVLRYGFAQRHFGTGASIVGRHAILNEVPVVIVGVTSERFLGVMTGYASDVWLPLEAQSPGHLEAWFDSLGPGYGIRLSAPWKDQPGIFWLWLTARVPSGNRPAAAAQWTGALQPDLALIAHAAANPQAKGATLHAQVKLVSAAAGEGRLREDSSLSLTLLMALAGAVFLVGCLNLANLQSACLSARQNEVRVRISLGANRWRLLRQVLVEDALLALAGVALAIIIGRAASMLLLPSSRGWLLDLDLHMGTPVILLGSILLVTALCAFSLQPAWRFTRSSFDAATGSKWRHAEAPQSRSARRWSSAMLAGQVSLSLLLASMAGCFAETLIHLARVDTGMDREHVLSVHVDLTNTGYASHQTNLPVLYRTLVERMQALPQVRGTAVAMCEIPGCGWNTAIHVFGKANEAEAELHGEEDHVGPGYFRATGTSLLRGRDFSDADRGDTQRVAILNRAYAKKLFGHEDPIGHWIGYQPAPHDHEFLIVGEVADAQLDGLRSAPPPVLYLSIDQNPGPIRSIEVRTVGPSAAMAAQIRQAIRKLDPDLPVTEIVPLNTELNDGLTTETLLARLTGTLAGLTLALAALGFYGVMSFRVARRRNEIGIRMALGATRGHVQLLILRQTSLILAAGVLPGLFLAEITAHAARSILYGSVSSHWPAFAAAVAALIAAGILATWAPARRAASVDPMETLHSE